MAGDNTWLFEWWHISSEQSLCVEAPLLSHFGHSASDSFNQPWPDYHHILWVTGSAGNSPLATIDVLSWLILTVGCSISLAYWRVNNNLGLCVCLPCLLMRSLVRISKQHCSLQPIVICQGLYILANLFRELTDLADEVHIFGYSLKCFDWHLTCYQLLPKK